MKIPVIFMNVLYKGKLFRVQKLTFQKTDMLSKLKSQRKQIGCEVNG